MKKFLFFSIMALASATLFSQVTIGRTSYDVQSNNGAKHRIHVYADGSISGLFTGSQEYVTGTTYPDRGMFYNHYNGVAWGAYPTARIEPSKTGFGELLHVGDHEVTFAHDGLTPSHIQIFANAAVGGTLWTELAGSDDVIGLWPMAYCPEGTDDIYIVTANANPPTALNFSRSDDGGATWAVLNQTVPFLTAADGIPGLNTGLLQAAETYQIAAMGTDVYILFGMVSSDLVMIHSDGNGAEGTWTNQVIHNFPLNAYDGFLQTDTNGDFVTDTIPTTDGYHSMIITDDGTVHVFSGYVRIYNDGIGAYWSYNYNNSMKMWHWQTGMDEATTIDLTLDWNNDDGLNDPDAGIGVYRAHYRYAGLTSTPGVAIDESNNHLYLTYTMPIEYTDIYDDPLNPSAQSYRDIFGVYSSDGGISWSTPVDLTNTASSGLENIYQFVNPKVEGGKIHVVWQRDELPGTIITDLDPMDTSWIMYNAWTPEDFGDSGEEICNTATGPGGLFADGITTNGATLHWDDVPLADQYIVAFWNADDLATVRKKRPATNMYTIPNGVLLPETTYGFRVKTVCIDEGAKSPYSSIYYFTTLPGRVGEFSQSVMLYPNPADGFFNIQLNGYQNSEADLMIVNSVGQVVMQKHYTINDVVYTENIDISDFAAGIYQVTIFQNGKMETKTLVVE